MREKESEGAAAVTPAAVTAIAVTAAAVASTTAIAAGQRQLCSLLREDEEQPFGRHRPGEPSSLFRGQLFLPFPRELLSLSFFFFFVFSFFVFFFFYYVRVSSPVPPRDLATSLDLPRFFLFTLHFGKRSALSGFRRLTSFHFFLPAPVTERIVAASHCFVPFSIPPPPVRFPPNA